MSAIPTLANLRAGLEAVSHEAAGAVEIAVILQRELPEVAGAALAGNRFAEQAFSISLQLLRRIETAWGTPEPALCACCPQPLRPGGRFSFAAAIPARDAPHQAIGIAICGKCATEPKAVQAKAVEAFRRYWPDLRSIEVTHPRGSRA